MAKYKYKISEMSKKASADEAEKELGIPKSRFEVGQVSFSKDGTSKSTITDIDPVTGAVRWEITQLPGFDKLYDDLTDLVNTAKRTYVKTKDDKKFRDFYDEIRVIRNKVRTHLRNEYPDQYKRITRIGEMFSKDILDLDKKIKEDDVDEISTSAGAGAYLTPYAFRLKGQKPDDEAYTELGYKPVKENYRGVEFEDYINELEKTMYVERQSGDRIVIHPLDKPDVRRPGRDYIVIDGNNVIAVQGYNSGPISVLADRYGLDEKDSRLTPTGKTTATGRISLLSSNILKDAIKAIKDSRDAEAKRQEDYYARRGPVSGTIDEGTCGYDRDKNGKKLKGPGGLGEAIDLVHVYDKDGSIFGTGEIIQKLPNDKVKVRFDGNFMGTFRADRVKPIEEGDTYEKMAAKGKKAGNLKQGTVRKRLGIKKGEKIPLSKINKEISRLKKMDKDKDKAGVQLGDKNQKYYKALQLSKTLKTTTNVNEEKYNPNNPGATLGPGPAAGPDGVKDNYYVKAFKYKLVPKKIKGSGIEVKKLY